MRRAIGGGLAALALLLFLVASFASPQPLTIHEVASRIDPERGWAETPAPERSVPIDSKGLRIVVAGGRALEYDGERGATLVAARFCSHRLCGPGVWIAGDLTATPRSGPWLLVPLGEGTVTLEALASQSPGGDPESARGSQSRGQVGVALSATFEARSVWPALLPRLAAVAAAAVGLAFLPQRESRGWNPAVAGVALLGVLAGAAMRPSAWLLHAFLNLLAVLAGFVGLAVWGVAAAFRRRAPAFAVALAIGAPAFYGAGALAATYFPASGAGD